MDKDKIIKHLKQIQKECLKRIKLKDTNSNEKKKLKKILYKVNKKIDNIKIESYSTKNDDSDEIDEIKKKIEKMKNKIYEEEKILLKKKEKLNSKRLSLKITDINYNIQTSNLPHKNILTLKSNDKNFDDEVYKKIEQIMKILPSKLKNNISIDSKDFLESVKETSDYSNILNFFISNEKSIDSIKEQNKNINIIEFYLSILDNRIREFYNNYNKIVNKKSSVSGTKSSWLGSVSGTKSSVGTDTLSSGTKSSVGTNTLSSETNDSFSNSPTFSGRQIPFFAIPIVRHDENINSLPQSVSLENQFLTRSTSIGPQISVDQSINNSLLNN